MSQHKWKEAYLKPADIQANWFRRLTKPDQDLSCDFMNFAFHTHDLVETAIDGCMDTQRRQKMKKKFWDCVTSGWGFGVTDMAEAQRHLLLGVWKDPNTGKYWYTSGKPKLYPGGSGIQTAAACNNFVRAVEDNLKELKELGAEYAKLAKEIERENNKPDKDFKKIGELLGKVKDNAERAEPFLWSSPKIQSRVVTVKNFADYVGKLHTAATRIVKLQSLNLSTGEALALAGAATALDYVPILGSLYGAAVDWAIDFIPQWKQFMQNYHLRLDLASKGADYTRIKLK